MMQTVFVDEETGEEIRLRQTGADNDGAFLEFDNYIPAGLGGPPSHAHPRQTEHFEVLQGKLKVCVDGQWSVLEPGQTAQVPANCLHTFDNTDQPDLVMRVRLSPALDAERLYDGLLGLHMQRSKLGALMRLSRLMCSIDSWFYMSGPVPLQRLGFRVLSAIARLFGVEMPRAGRPEVQNDNSYRQHSK